MGLRAETPCSSFRGTQSCLRILPQSSSSTAHTALAAGCATHFLNATSLLTCLIATPGSLADRRPLCPAYLSSRLLLIHISGSESGIASLHRRFRLNEKCDLKCPHCALTPPYGDFLFNRFVSVDCRENRQRQGAGVGRTLWALCSGLSPEIGDAERKELHAS